jgi:hypothetical protein
MLSLSLLDSPQRSAAYPKSLLSERSQGPAFSPHHQQSCHPERSVAKSKDLRVFLSLLFCLSFPSGNLLFDGDIEIVDYH